MSKGWKVKGEVSWDDAIAGLLPHQKQFLARSERNAAFVGGMGCCSAETIIAGVPIAEWPGRQVDDRFYGPGFLKSRADLYKVSTQSGRQVVVTVEHRFLTPTGWRRLADLSIGSLIAVDGSARALLDSGTPLDSPALGSHCSHLHDELPHPVEAAFRHKLQQLRRLGVDSSALELYTHLSTDDSLCVSDSATLAGGASHLRATSGGALLLPAWNCLPRRSDTIPQAGGTSLPPDTVKQSPALVEYASAFSHSSTASIVDSNTCRLVPSVYVDTFWDEIQAITFVRHGQFYDITVPEFEHYSAQGLWHHNSGKSFVLCVLAILNAMRDPNGFSLIARLNYPALINSTMKIFLELVPERYGEFLPTDKRFRFVNGHEIVFHHLDISDPKVAGPIKSMNLSAAYIDEATEISQDIYLLVDGRVRRKTASMNMVRLASNPAGHDYVWRMYFDPNRKPAFQHYFGINCTMMDNTHLSAEYVENARSSWPADWQERYVYGTFADFSDLIYKEFAESSHVWDSRKQHDIFGGLNDPPADWPVIIGIDIGSDTEHDPWAIVLIAVAPDGRLYQFDEIYGNGLLIANIADQLFAKLGERSRPDVAYDYAQRQCAMELAECGIVGQPAIKEVDPGIFKTAQYIHIDPRLQHPFTGAEGSPRYFVASRCTHTIDELTSYKWAKDRSGNATGKPAHEHSHSPSAVRYAIHTFRPLPEKPRAQEIWEAPHLDAMSRAYWKEQSAKPKERSGNAPLLRFQRSTSNLFSRPSVIRSKQGYRGLMPAPKELS